ncbi:Manganese ABC transporter substrate-binding lipoprotein precursor [Marinomonas gallaica]|uniref:High-affinity zinc uptake system protein ZnuA n=1 Tax=Marinomonas gallaica TaxID=1806667 RepID=A0A1C3JLG1_9GAMM|nr:zinc ABC transporter substrate-binding protein [Marinomonas gallaica]SBT16014.1 Manganese ABC transporter substrate-binding lipoprotein precursor [Marinomonas gallaica]SBT21062.1 Manganese ABC transporter substrate-binding lipoprotein precursor [Marinomonas gallaica]
MRYLLLSLLVLISTHASARLQVGITLHPYYSYVSHILGDRGDVLPLVEAGFNPHNYQLSPADIERLNSLDALVVNGIGHDLFATNTVDRLQPDNLTVIYANKDVPLIGHDEKVNPHSFVSIDAGIRQVYTIAKALGELDPDNKTYFLKNALAYAKTLRALKTPVQQALLDKDVSNLRIASTHGAYAYLLQEFGLTVSAVIEPAHGVSPTASQLEDTIDTIRKQNIDVLFTELNMENRYVDLIERETGIKVYYFSHMTHGDYSKDQVEREMGNNLAKLAEALQ